MDIDPNLCYIENDFTEIDLQVEKLWESEHETEDFFTPLVIDIDGDCFPEILTISKSKLQIIVSDSKDGSIKHTVEIDGGAEMIAADVDDDGEIELIVRVFGFPSIDPLYRGRLVSYNLDSSINWISNVEYNSDIQINFSENLGLADFNKDGIPEVYLLNEIYNSLNGVKLLDGGDNGKGFNSLVGKSIAVELDGDNSSLELAAGYTIYQVEITNLIGEVDNILIPINISLNGSFRDGPTIVADVDGDNDLDIIVSSRINGSSPGIYVYDYNNGIPQIISEINKPELNSTYFTSSPAVFNNVELDTFFLVYAIIDSIECLYYKNGLFENMWTLPFSDIQATNGIVAFDLDNDGVKEIVFRDEENLQIITNIRSNAPTILQFGCRSGTVDEKPVIASIDSTKEARICVTCCNEIGDKRLTVFGPPEGSHWAPARGIWNQYNYHVLNINDDGTVPQFQENNATYQDGRYNNFNVQASTLDEDGNMLSPAAQLTGDIACVDFDVATDTYTVTFDLYNLDDASLTADAGMQVSFYDGDPSVDGDLLGTYETLQSIARDESLIGLSYSFSASTLTRLFMAVNTDGSSPLNDEDYNILECDYTDNISQYIALPTITSSTGTVCDGSMYEFYGTSLSAPGDYYHDVVDTQGCDSVVVALLLTEDCGTGCEPIDTSLCYLETEFVNLDFQLEKKWESEDQIYSNSTPLVIDVDGDCELEIVGISASRTDVVIINAENGSNETTIGVEGVGSMAVADCDGNGQVEIYIATFGHSFISDNIRGRIVSYNLDGSRNWISDVQYDSEIQFSETEALSFADFNKDGVPEIYYFNEIYNSLNGVKIADGGNSGKGFNSEFGNSIACELDGDLSSLELVAGYSVYHVDIANLNGTTNNQLTPYNIEVEGGFYDGSTIVSDVNHDGTLDVIVSGVNANFESLIYSYEYNSGSMLILDSIDNLMLNGISHTGTPLLLKASEANDTFYLVFTISNFVDCYTFTVNGGFEKKWSVSILDFAAQNGVVAFDFDNDGLKEVVYRGVNDLMVIKDIDSNSPTVIKSNCASGTGIEKPIVASLDSSGESKICVTCQSQDGEQRLTVFGPPEGSHWAPARGIWNQYNYHVLNINDDGTVPQFQENNATYLDARYNNFNVQASTLDEDGNMLSPAAQLTGDIACVDFDAATDTYTITFDLYNLDDASLTADAGMSVSFYDGDPSVDGDLLGTYETLQSIARDESLIGLSYSFSASTLTRLFMAVNTDGSSPLNDEDYDILECDYTDNISQHIALPTIVEVMASVCNGSMYEFYGMSLSAPGDYYHDVDDTQGCDSVVVALLLTEDCDTGCEPIDTSLCYVETEFADLDLQVEKLWESEDETNDINTPLVIDVDGDCIPEIISISRSNFQIIITDSKDGSTKFVIETAGLLDMVLADCNNDGQVEFIVRISGNDLLDPSARGRLISYNLDGSINWVSNVEYNEEIQLRVIESLGLADFNKDGIPEVYLLNEIYNALTGVKILDGGDNGKGYNLSYGKSIAAELDGISNSLELAAGYTIYQVDITNVSGESGNVMTPYNITINGAIVDGPTIVADVNDDGSLDVIVSSRSTPGIYAYEYNNGVPQIIAETSNLEIGNSVFTGIPTVFQNHELDTLFIAFAVADSIECYYYEAGFFNNLWTLPF